jgi:glycosyltransferase involved in cell wall biosynthesis
LEKDMLHQPLVSVIIPVFNCEQFIAEAIDSVLQQGYDPLEIVVIDDGSTDKTADVVKGLSGNIFYHYQNNAGIAEARNKGLELAGGEWIGFIDADDVWLDNKLNLQAGILSQNPDIEMVIGFLVPLPFENRNDVTEKQIKTGKIALALQLGSTLIRKSVFNKIGGFDPELTMAEDSDWFFRVMEADVRVHVLQEIVQLYRQHDNNITKDKPGANSYMLKAFKKSLDRRRKAGVSTEVTLPAFGNIEQVKQFWLTNQQ